MKRHAPAAARNSQPIAEVLARELPETGTVLEVASGSGQHAVFFARTFPHLDWQPSDVDADALASIDAYASETGLANLRPAAVFDATGPDAPLDRAAAILCINMVHISPWSATEGLFGHAARILPTDGPLILYGPYLEGDVDTTESNLAFDESLKSRDPAWGLRRSEAIDELARSRGFKRTARYAMPANNIILVYRRSAGD
ncbi:DUF938 domain-containing protein [Qipengyuania sp. MTN3-11]|uniref:DUF938 domain-containing protein n=1 Tax=Qipengyuania sp. MTN3-11 TaxID=3056557 RepID=UPI0036F41690